MHRNYFFLKQLTIKVINYLEGKFLSGIFCENFLDGNSYN